MNIEALKAKWDELARLTLAAQRAEYLIHFDHMREEKLTAIQARIDAASKEVIK